MKDAIGYPRVSTREQGRSGLGLTAPNTRSKLLRCSKKSRSGPGIRIFSDCLEARPPAAKRSLHHRAHGA